MEQCSCLQTRNAVEGQEHRPIEVAILAAFLFYRYKFVSRAKDKNLYRSFQRRSFSQAIWTMVMKLISLFQARCVCK